MAESGALYLCIWVYFALLVVISYTLADPRLSAAVGDYDISNY